MKVTPESLADESESSQQTALFCWAANEVVEAQKVDDFNRMALMLLHAIPNGDQRGDGTSKGAAIAGNRLKREGLRSGVPDVCFPVPLELTTTKGYPVAGYTGFRCPGLYIEMKKPALKRAADPLHGCSDEQLKWIEALRTQGYRVEVCYTWIEAREVILDYLGLPSQLKPWGMPRASI